MPKGAGFGSAPACSEEKGSFAARLFQGRNLRPAVILKSYFDGGNQADGLLATSLVTKAEAETVDPGYKLESVCS
jgi:hypothetical protein